MQVIGYNSVGSIDIVNDSGNYASVPDDMANRDRQEIYRWEFKHDVNGNPINFGGNMVRLNTIPPYVAPEDQEDYEPPAYKLYKSVFIRRLTSEEAGVMEQVLAAADAKLRLLFNSVEYFVSDDPLFDGLLGAVSAAFGATRAEELLSPEVA